MIKTLYSQRKHLLQVLIPGHYVGKTLTHRISIEFMTQCGKCDVVTAVLSPWLKVSKTACSSCSISTFCAHTHCTLFLSPSRRSGSSWAVGEALGSGARQSGFTHGFPMCPCARYGAVLCLVPSSVKERQWEL